MVDMRAQLVWRGDSRLVQLGGCIPTPLLADVRASTSVDHLIDAMFAARGLKMEALATPPSSSTDKLGPVWWDASRSFGRLYMPSTEDATAMTVPYAETMVARDADAMAEKPTLDAMQAWQKDLKEPLISSYVWSLLTQPLCPLGFPYNASVPIVLVWTYSRWPTMAAAARAREAGCRGVCAMHGLPSVITRFPGYDFGSTTVYCTNIAGS